MYGYFVCISVCYVCKIILRYAAGICNVLCAEELSVKLPDKARKGAADKVRKGAADKARKGAAGKVRKGAAGQ